MQNILNKLHKFTSAQEPIKVELGMSSDIEANIYESEAILKTVNKLKSQIISEAKNVDFVEKRLRLYEKTLLQYAKDLGVESPYLKEIRNALNNLDKVKKLL